MTSGSARDVKPSNTYVASACNTKMPTNATDARDDRGDDRAPPEVLDHVISLEAAGVPHEVHGREVRARR